MGTHKDKVGNNINIEWLKIRSKLLTAMPTNG